MIHSRKNGDYKFPGGGLERNETHEETLLREVKEESGAMVCKIEKGFGKVTEYDIPTEEEYDVFKMTSYYYICKIDDKFEKQSLDEYEEDLGFRPVWINIDDAIKANKALIINSDNKQVPRWVTREASVLEQIRKQLIKKGNL